MLWIGGFFCVGEARRAFSGAAVAVLYGVRYPNFIVFGSAVWSEVVDVLIW